MKDRIITNNIRNIKKSFLRFLSLLVMGALGMFAFSGLMATAPDMKKSLDNYLDAQKAYDIRIISDLGLDIEDVAEIEKLSHIEAAEGAYYRDAPIITDADEGMVNISSLPENINLIEIVSGKLPVSKNEIAIEEDFLKQNNVSIGDIIKIEDEEGFYETEAIITGTVKSPLFYNSVNIANDRGVTNVGSGIINYFAYMPQSNFKADYLSVIYARVKGAEAFETGTDKYNSLIESAMEEIENISDGREEARYEKIISMANDKIDEGAKDAQAQLDDAKNELNSAKAELDAAAKTIADGEKQLLLIKQELDKAGRQLTEAKSELAGKENEFEEGKAKLEEAGRELGEKKAQLEEAGKLLDDGLKLLQEKQEELNAAKQQLNSGKQLLDEKQRLADEGALLITEGQKELEWAREELKNAKAQAQEGKQELDLRQAQFEEARELLTQGKAELDSGKSILDTSKNVFTTISQEYDRLRSSENIAEDIINSELERLRSDIDALRGIFEKIVSQYREGTLSLESARAVIAEALENYTREPTILERLVFYRVAISYLEPLIAEGEEEYNRGLEEITKGERELEEGRKALEEGRRQYSEGLKAIADGEEKLLSGERELEDKKKELESGRLQLKAGYDEYENALKLLNEGEAALQSGYEEYNANMAAFIEGSQLLEEAEEQYLAGVEELLSGEELINAAKAQIEEGEKEYKEGLLAYEEGEKELATGKNEFEEGNKKYRSGLAEYEKGRANFDEEIRKARLQLDDINKPTWYIYDRTGYQTYSDYFDDAQSIANLSTVFPIVFFLVAILVSLISMSRMVEMDRLEIGTLKSLGYSREKVLTKYAFFSILATTLGALLGAVLGLIIMPTMIFNIYGILFDIPKLYLSANIGPTMIGFAAIMLFVVGAGMLKAVQVMREKPADLLRPKAPKPGKRILLERITPVWKRLKFSDKITIRNLFRYKRRLFVTVFGITGCTSLILCGFGLKDAIVDIPNAQFEEVFDVDVMCYMTGMDDTKRDEQKISRILDEKEILSYTETMRINAECEGYSTYIFAVEKADDIKNMLILKERGSAKEIEPEHGKVIITEKLSRLTGLKSGDEITLTDINHVEHIYTISGVANNYFEHYVIVDKETLEQYVDFAPNLIYLKTDELTGEQQEDLTKRLLENPPVLTVAYREKLIEKAGEMLKSLDKVVIILIILSAMLSFVVLYNLSNININERHREIATLKVLGFYDKEVDDYINRENAIVTAFGIAAGLIIGIFLTKIVVGTVEIEKASFINHIKPLSYILAAAMSASFTFLVNRITHFNLKRINMIDSLKSVE